MSKHVNVAVLAVGLVLIAGSVKADEVTRSTSTQVDNPDYSAKSNSSTTTTTDDNPTTVKQESSYSESSPGQEKQVTTRKKYIVPKRQQTVTKHTETETEVK